jgi:hypothetical protein
MCEANMMEKGAGATLLTAEAMPLSAPKDLYDLTYVTVTIILPSVANLLLSLDVANYLTNVLELCQCFYAFNLPHNNNDQNPRRDVQTVVLNNQCIGINGPNATSLPMNNLPPAPRSSDFSCEMYSADMTKWKLTVVIVASISLTIVTVLSAIVWWKKVHVAVLAASFVTVIPEFTTSFVIIFSPQPFLDPSSLFYLQLGIIFSTGIAFFLNFFDQGDAQVLSNMRIVSPNTKRLIILSLFQLLYIFSLGANIGALGNFSVVSQLQ